MPWADALGQLSETRSEAVKALLSEIQSGRVWVGWKDDWRGRVSQEQPPELVLLDGWWASEKWVLLLLAVPPRSVPK